jgi:hypothetical protein
MSVEYIQSSSYRDVYEAVNPPVLIGVSGYAGVGKDTVAERLCLRIRNSVIVSMSAPLKAAVANALGTSPLMLERVKNSFRPLLVQFGSVGRYLDPEMWIKRVRKLIDESRSVTPRDLYFITGIRYLNEAEWIIRSGGVVLGIDRIGVFPANQKEAESIEEMKHLCVWVDNIEDRIDDCVQGCIDALSGRGVIRRTASAACVVCDTAEKINESTEKE